MPRSRGFRLTERDAELVAFTARFHGVEAAQLAERFRMDRADVYHRARRLADRDLLAHERVLHGRPGIYTATSAGLRWVGSPLPLARPSLHAYHHAVELVWVAIALEREFGPAAVLSEREIRRRDMVEVVAAERRGARPRPRYGLVTERQAETRALHFPDLVVEGGAADGATLAIELELTSKGGGRRARIVRAYRDSTHVGQVRYYAPDGPLKLLERTVSEQRGNEFGPVFDLRPYAPRCSR